jgi:uncharacterized protein (TIGR02145 family)
MVQVGEQVWMAENLAHEPGALNCSDVYGCYYDWAAAMGLGEEYNSEKAVLGLSHQGICPEGWHVPYKIEWEFLTSQATVEQLAAQSWTAVSGQDIYGFAALPGGISYRLSDEIYNDNSARGEWWSADQNDSGTSGWAQEISSSSSLLMWNKENNHISVRCLRN